MKHELMKDIIEKLNHATKAYDQGRPYMSDPDWDRLYGELEKLEKELGYTLPDSPTQKVIYQQTVLELNKVNHNHRMLSLAKTKDLDEVKSFLGDKKVVIMAKMDGLTCSLRYVDGKLVSAETRGDGLIGEDVTHNAMVIKSIPKRINYKEELIVDGEIICTKEAFKPFEKEYKNPRNFAAGSIRLLDSAECAKRNLTFVAWDVIKGFEQWPTLIDRFLCIKDLGFTIVPSTPKYTTLELDLAYIQEIVEHRGYPIDGIVFKFNDIAYGKSLGSTSHHFNNAIAYKFYDETHETRLRYIEWTMGRTGVLTPVAVFEPIEIDGATVERASLHNVSVMREIMGNCCYAGQRIEVFKANQIIPQIMSADKMDYGDVVAHGGITVDGFSGEIYCPICGGSTSLKESDSGTINLVCDEPTCKGKLINRLDHFCSKKGLDIKGLSKATLEKLIDWGYVNDLDDLFNLDMVRDVWIKQPGFGEKSVNKIIAAVYTASQTATLDAVISAAGIPLIGRTVATDLAKRFKTYENFREHINKGFDFSHLDGYGPEMSKALLTFDYGELDFIVGSYMKIYVPEDKEESKAKSLEGTTFVITGKLKMYKNRDALKAEIEAHGGKVSGSVTKKTDYLINNDINSTTAKNKTAKELDVPIITEEDFINIFDI